MYCAENQLFFLIIFLYHCSSCLCRVPCLISSLHPEESKTIFFCSQKKLFHTPYLCSFQIYHIFKLGWLTLQAILEMHLCAFIRQCNHVSHFLLSPWDAEEAEHCIPNTHLLLLPTRPRLIKYIKYKYTNLLYSTATVMLLTTSHSLLAFLWALSDISRQLITLISRVFLWLIRDNSGAVGGDVAVKVIFSLSLTMLLFALNFTCKLIAHLFSVLMTILAYSLRLDYLDLFCIIFRLCSTCCYSFSISTLNCVTPIQKWLVQVCTECIEWSQDRTSCTLPVTWFSIVNLCLLAINHVLAWQRTSLLPNSF